MSRKPSNPKPEAPAAKVSAPRAPKASASRALKTPAPEAPVPAASVTAAPVAAPPAPVTPPLPPGIAHLPLPLLVMPMGLGGLGLAWREAAATLGAPGFLGEALLLLTALVWLAVVGAQAARGLLYPEALLAEFRHPVRVAFLAAPTIGLIILSGALHPYAPGLGAALWAVAVPLHLIVAMLILRRMLAGRGEVAMLAPPLLIPFVGNILAPVFGVRMGFVDASWMVFGVGLLMWLVTMPLLLHRLIAGPALPLAMRPSLAIFLAPPAVGALAIVALTGGVRGVSLTFTGVALLVAAALISLARDFVRVPFSLTWWGFTFPTAAFAVLLMVEGFHPLLAGLALALNTGLTGWIIWRTALAARAGVFLRPEAH